MKQAGIIIFTCSTLLTPAAVYAQQTGSTTESVSTLREKDTNGVLRITEKTVTRRTLMSTGEEVVTEIYQPLVYERRLDFWQRIRRTTTNTSYGSEIVEETEEVPRSSPHERPRIVKRTVTTVRRNGTEDYVTERRDFERDANGRLVPKTTQVDRGFRR